MTSESLAVADTVGTRLHPAARRSSRSHGEAIRLLTWLLASLALAALVALAGEALDRPESVAAHQLADARLREDDTAWCRRLNGKVFCYGEPD